MEVFPINHWAILYYLKKITEIHYTFYSSAVGIFKVVYYI